MSVKATMAYLRFERERQHISQADVARAAGVESKQVYRWERGDSEPNALGLAAFIAVVGADPIIVQRLMLDENATAEDGRRAALEPRPAVAGDEQGEATTSSKRSDVEVSALLDEIADELSAGKQPRVVARAFLSALRAAREAAREEADAIEREQPTRRGRQTSEG